MAESEIFRNFAHAKEESPLGKQVITRFLLLNLFNKLKYNDKSSN